MEEPELKLATIPEPGHPVRKYVVAAIIMAIIAAAVFLLNPRKTADVSIVKVEVYAPHTESKQLAGTMHVVGSAPVAEDDLYVVATVRITDKLRLPLFLNGYTASLINPDGTQLDASAISLRDLSRLEQTFPALIAMTQRPLDDKTPVAPGETREGTVVLQFPGLTAAAWSGRKSASLTVALTHQSPQIIDFPPH